MKIDEVLGICVGILTLVVAVIASVNGLLPLLREKNTKLIKAQLNEFNKLKERIEDLSSTLYYLLLSTTDNIEDDILESIKNFNNSRILNNCGICFLNKSRNVPTKRESYLDKSIELFKLALKASKDKTGKKQAIIYTNLADAYDDKDAKKEAFQNCEKALRCNEDCAQAYNLLASLYIKENNIKFAREYAEKAIEYSPNNGFAYLTMAESYFQNFDEKKDAETVMNYIKLALENGCPVWEYYNDELYVKIKTNTNFWSDCERLINDFQAKYKIARMTLKCEHEYII